MKCFSTHLAACLLITVSCLIWAAAIAYVLVSWLELSSRAGWMIAGFFGFSAILLAVITSHELKNAIELPDFTDSVDARNVPAAERKNDASKSRGRVPAV